MWPSSLVQDIAARRAVIFFGAGVSMNSFASDGITKPKSWIGFLKEASKTIDPKIQKNINKLIKENDLLTACDVIRRKVGHTQFVELVKNEFQNPGFTPAKIHELIWKLDVRITITPNFDNIYDILVSSRGNGTVSIKNYMDDDIADALRRHERVLIKSHGTVTSPNKLIFTRTDYAKARNQHRDFYELLDSLLRTHTFLFIGCGLNDPDIRILLEDYCFRHQYAQDHYFVMASKQYSNEILEIFQESLKIKILKYDYTPDHSNLGSCLEDLVNAVEQKRDEIGKNQTW